MAKFPHLEPDVAAVAELDAAARIEFIQRDRFVETRQTEGIHAFLCGLVERPPSIRPRCMALVGDGGSGKSTILDRFIQANDGAQGSTQLVAYCVMPAAPYLAELKITVMSVLGLPMLAAGRRSLVGADDQIKRAVGEMRLRVLVLDEAQHIGNLPKVERAIAWDWLKWLSTTCRISVVVVGMPSIAEMVKADLQLRTRFRAYKLDNFAFGPALKQFLEASERSYPLRLASNLGSDGMQRRVLKESAAMDRVAGIKASVNQILEAAAVDAVLTGRERIDVSNLDAWRGPLR